MADHARPLARSRRRSTQPAVALIEANLQRRRIEQTKALLAAAPRPVAEVAFAVGFNDLSYFARVLRRLAGLPASAWLDLHSVPPRRRRASSKSRSRRPRGAEPPLPQQPPGRKKARRSRRPG